MKIIFQKNFLNTIRKAKLAKKNLFYPSSENKIYLKPFMGSHKNDHYKPWFTLEQNQIKMVQII